MSFLDSEKKRANDIILKHDLMGKPITLEAFKQQFCKPSGNKLFSEYFIDELELVDDDFKYEIITPYDSPEYSNHFKFKTDEEYLSFMYEEFAMEIFGHSPSTEMSTFYDLNDLIVKKFKF